MSDRLRQTSEQYEREIETLEIQIAESAALNSAQKEKLEDLKSAKVKIDEILPQEQSTSTPPAET